MNNKLPSIFRVRPVIRIVIHFVAEYIFRKSDWVNNSSKVSPEIFWRKLDFQSYIRRKMRSYLADRTADEASQEAAWRKLENQFIKASKAPPKVNWRSLERPAYLRRFEEAPPYVASRKA